MYLEIIRKPGSTKISNSDLTKACIEVIRELKFRYEHCILNEDRLRVVQDENVKDNVFALIVNKSVHIGDGQNAESVIYRLDPRGPQSDCFLGEESQDGLLPLSTNWALPSLQLHGCWERLVYNTPIKNQLLQYAKTVQMLTQRAIDPSIMSLNKIILLHGPPGTGKTSLCRAMAHKLSVAMYASAISVTLIELNARALFSKWFSESSRLVSKMFLRIKEICAEDNQYVIVLVDEVESLTHARHLIGAGTEPSDAIKVVNSLLTELDSLSSISNVLILTTSNMTNIIDAAFIDRADLKIFVGLPTRDAISRIYLQGICELIRKGIITDVDGSLFNEIDVDTTHLQEHNKFTEICSLSEGLSGRCLSKIPFLTCMTALVHTTSVPFGQYLLCMQEVVDEQLKSEKVNHLNKNV